MKVYIAKDFNGGVWAYALKPWMKDGLWYGGVISPVPAESLTPDDYQLLDEGKLMIANAVLEIARVFDKQIVEEPNSPRI